MITGAPQQTTIHSVRRAGRLAALGLAVALAPSAGWADFSPTRTISAPGHDAFDPQVAVDADGDALFVWQLCCAESRIQAQSRTAAGALGPVQFLSAEGVPADHPQLAMNADGDTLVVWVGAVTATTARIQARAVSKTGVLGPILNLSGPDAFDPQVAIDAQGDGLAVWVRPDGAGIFRIQARAVSRTGALGTVRTLSAAGANADDPQVASDANGDALVVWELSGFADTLIQARRWTNADVPGQKILTLSESGVHAQDPHVALNSRGNGLVVWDRPVFPDKHKIQGRAVPRRGALGPVLNLSRDDGFALEPGVASDADGDSLVVWQRHHPSVGGPSRIQARARTKAGVLGPIQNLHRATENGRNPQVASDIDGDAVVVWERGSFDVNRIQARARTKEGVLGPVQTLSRVKAAHPQVAVGANGVAHVVWQRHNGTNWRIQTAVGP